MNILYITSNPVPSQAANSVHVMKMAQALAMEGHDVTLVAPEYNRKSKSALSADAEIYDYYGVQAVFRLYHTQSFLRGRAGLALHILQTLFLLLRIRAELVYSRCLATSLFLSALGFPVLFERHDSFKAGGMQERAFKWILNCKRGKGVVVISKALAEHFTALYRPPVGKLIVAPDGADAMPEGEKPALPPAPRLRVGYVGHLYKGRGIDVIIALARAHSGYEFHVVGGRDEDIVYWQSQTSGLQNLFFHGHVPHCQAMSYLLSFDILLAPYQKAVSVDGGGNTVRWMSPLKIFEYMAAGKAIICSDIPVLHEILVHEENCLFCPPEDVTAWGDAIDQLAGDPELAGGMGEQALQDFLSRYTWDARARHVISCVEQAGAG